MEEANLRITSKLQALTYQGGPWTRDLWLYFLVNNTDGYWPVSPTSPGE